MNRFAFCWTIVLLTLVDSAVEASTISILHSFTGATNDGYSPTQRLVPGGQTLYGKTATTVFALNADGSNYHIVSLLPSGSNGGVDPSGDCGLTLSGSTIYGMTAGGGNGSRGGVFSVGTNGSNYSLLYSFAGGTTDGQQPTGSLAFDGTSFFGMTHEGGQSNYGTLFTVNEDGSGERILHSFSGSDGSLPWGSGLVLSGTTLYGMTQNSIFSIGTDGSNYRFLRSSFQFWGNLVLSGSTLYGMSTGGPAYAVFSVDTALTQITTLHTLAGGVNDGGSPYGCGLALSGSTLYGMTNKGGTGDDGTIFSMNVDGSSFALLHSFTRGTNDGGNPRGISPTILGSQLYGMTRSGGQYGSGVVFALPIPEPSSLTLFLVGAIGLLAYVCRRGSR